MIAHRSPISGIAAHGGSHVATAGYDNQIILWDAGLKMPLGRAVHDHLVNQVAFSADGRHLVSSSSDHTARLWSLPTLKLLAVMSAQVDDVEMSAFHPHRELIATASRDHRARVYDFHGRLQRLYEGHTADVISVAWSSDGTELVTSSDDGTIKRWSLDTGDLVSDTDLGGIETDTVAIAPDGTIHAGDDAGHIISIARGEVRRHAAHAAGIKRLVFQPDAARLVSLSYDRTLRIWSTRGPGLHPLARTDMPAPIWPRSCAFLDAQRLVFATFGSRYATYHMDADRWDTEGVDPTPGINAVAVHEGRRHTIGDAGILHIDGVAARGTGSLCNFLTPAGPFVFTGGQTGQVMDALSGQVFHQHRSPLNCGVAFERRGIPHVAIGTYTGEGLVFALAPDGAVRLVETLRLHANAVKSLAVSDGRLFSVCADTAVAWFATDDLREIARIEHAHDRIANGCAALPGGRFVSVSRDRKLRIWSDGQPRVVDTPLRHSIKCVATSADGRLVASGSYAGEVAVFDIDTGVWLERHRPTCAGISSLAFEPATGKFLASSYDGRVHELGLAEAAA